MEATIPAIASSFKLRVCACLRLSLNVGGMVRQLDEARVREVQRDGGSLRNGMLIGGGFGLPSALLADPQYRPCTTAADGTCAQNDVGYRILFVGMMGGIGAGKIDSRDSHKFSRTARRV